MNVKYRVELTDAEREELRGFVATGSKLARKVKRAQVLLAADQGYSDENIANTVGVGTSTVYPQREELVDMVVESFPWTVADVLGNPERT